MESTDQPQNIITDQQLRRAISVVLKSLSKPPVDTFKPTLKMELYFKLVEEQIPPQ